MEKFDIDQLYTRLLPRMEVLEQERIVLAGKLNKLKTISIGVTIILVIGIGFLMDLFWGLLLGAVLGITFYTILHHKMIGAYRKNYKLKVFHELVSELGNNYSYAVDGMIDDEVIRESGIFHKFTKVKCEDMIEGTFDDYSFHMAETNLWFDSVRNERHTQSGGAHSYIFKGLFFVGEIPLSFPTAIWILSKDHPKVHPISRVQEDWQKVRVDHSAFRLEYDVYASDKEMAAQILQPGILDTIIKAKENVVDSKMRFELSFQNNKVYISISTIKELFEPPVKTPVTDKEDFKANFKYLVNTTGLLQQLTLVKS
jgi:hypothetical protein